MRQFLLILLFLLLSLQLYSQVRINEFSSSNLSGITDEDGDRSDWIELFNHSASAVSLDGYHLSDDASFLKKWTFPAVTMKPESYMIIFASDKNRTGIPLSYQTIITKGAEWKYLVPPSDIGNSWQTSGFDASSWNTGASGFGYGDNDDSTVLNNIISVYIRKEFLITDPAEIRAVILSIDYDDGFVAYLNGHEIARSNLGIPGSAVAYDQLTGSLQREATMYQGGLPENYTISDPSAFIVSGLNVLAIEGHNCDPASSDFSLIPMLTIGYSGTGRLDSLPAYIQLKGSQLHTNFKINAEGETLILSRPDSTVADSVSPTGIMADFSYGRKPDGADLWFWFAMPTPGFPNSTRAYGSQNCDTVIFSARGGYYPEGVELQLTSTNGSDSIFYTLDGSVPTVSSSRYSAPFSISANTVVRARSIKSADLPGIISTNTYITQKHTLPVVCLSTDPVNLWDYNSGIYVLGPNASPDQPNFGANFWQDWEKKAHMELYDINGIKQIDQDIGIKIFGAWSRAFPQKSLALFARKEYGKGSFDYKFFKDKPIEKFESLVLRNAGNDWGQAMMRDGLTSTLIRDMDVDRQAFQPAVIYLNGEYWGILNIREKVNSNFLAENHFVDPDNVNLLEFNGSVVEGSNSSYMDLLGYLDSHTLENQQNYLKVSGKIDINSYIQYQLTQIYINNKDWPGNNIKFWNTNSAGSLWRWIIYDTDFGFSIWEDAAYTFNTLGFALETQGPDWPNPPWATLLFRRMISNPGFRKEFANQYADRLNTNFSSNRVSAVIDSVKNLFMPEVDSHLARWELSRDTWEYNYSVIKDYARRRPDYARNHLKTQLNLGELLSIKVVIDNPGSGTVRVNSIVPTSYPFTGVYFKDLPIRLTAIPAPGYRFEKWQIGTLVSTSVSIDYNMEAAATFKAVFSPARNTDIKIVINEISYKAKPDKDTKDWIELYNPGISSVNLKNWSISDSEHGTGYVFPSDIIFTPGMYIVVCRDKAAFSKIWPDVASTTGDMDFGLSSSGDNVNLYDPEGNLVDFVNYLTTPPWPTDVLVTGSSIELTDPFADNNDGKNWKSGLTGGSPGAKNFQTVKKDTTGELASTGCSLSCYPNPFHVYTTIRIEVSVSGKYKIEIYNTQGRLINTIADQIIETGEYYIDWNGRGSGNAPLPEGVYIIKLRGENQNAHSKVIILR